MSEVKEPAWAIVELMGHVRLAGRLSEEEKFGVKMGRLDVPQEQTCEKCGGSGNGEHSSGPDPVNDPCAGCLGEGKVPSFVTQYFGGGSVYRITYVTEEVARHVSKNSDPAPIRPWELPKQLAAKSTDLHEDDDYEHNEDF